MEFYLGTYTRDYLHFLGGEVFEQRILAHENLRLPTSTEAVKLFCTEHAFAAVERASVAGGLGSLSLSGCMFFFFLGGGVFLLRVLCWLCFWKYLFFGFLFLFRHYFEP